MTWIWSGAGDMKFSARKKNQNWKADWDLGTFSQRLEIVTLSTVLSNRDESTTPERTILRNHVETKKDNPSRILHLKRMEKNKKAFGYRYTPRRPGKVADARIQREAYCALLREHSSKRKTMNEDVPHNPAPVRELRTTSANRANWSYREWVKFQIQGGNKPLCLASLPARTYAETTTTSECPTAPRRLIDLGKWRWVKARPRMRKIE